jgi:DNA-binding FadR family transcriptional regulator
MPITSIEPRRLYRQVADQLRQLIDSGEFAAGARLPTERELAAQLGVSRPTVREALIALEVDGRIRIRVGSGIYVLPPAAAPQVADTAAPIAGPFEILKARALFEGAVAEEAARIATPIDISKIDLVLAEMREAQHPGPRSIAVDRAFHIAVADVLGNDAVTKVVGDLFDQRINPYFAQLARHFENAQSWHAALEEHQALRDCLAAHNADGARAAMQDHLQQSQLRFSETFGETWPVPPQRPATRPAPSRRSRPANVRKTPQHDQATRRKQT